jgi:hypothetical protein
MDWIKKNTTLVISIVVALVAVGGAGYYLMEKMGESADISAKFSAAVQRRDGLINKRPNHPGFVKVDNIKLVNEDFNRLTQFESELVKGFKSTTPVQPTERDFKQALADTLALIEKEGERSGLTTPTNFNMSFTAQKVGYRFASNSLDRLTLQLADLKVVAEILVDARVNSIESFRRVAVSEDDSGANAVTAEYIGNFAVTTNVETKAVIYPYEVSFRCFSEEFGDVLEGIAASPYSVLVKTIAIEPANVRNLKSKRKKLPGDSFEAMFQAATRYGEARPTTMTGPVGAGRGRADESAAMKSTYGSARVRPGANQPATGPLPPGGMPWMQPTGPEVLLQPEPLKITLGLAVVHMPESGSEPSSKK